MPSPFPGMDPYLEQASYWPEFHSHLMNTLFQAVVPGLLEQYGVRAVQVPEKVGAHDLVMSLDRGFDKCADGRTVARQA